ncbi:glutamate/aspartate ABC transporter substrate-binding protein, partial [Yersinia pestis]
MQMRKLALVLLLAGMTSSVAQAEDATAKADTAIDTLQKVKNNGVIVVGHRESS